ncbi:MAG: helix-turn-helix domain-containing protein [Deltaproteobacteria bacterium]|nr:helix-turn-helix domain-containing protein [Deltaproteobacteria bacterium]
MNDFMTYAEAAEFLHVKVGTLYSMTARRQLPHHRLGARIVRFSRADLIAWVAQHRVEVVGVSPGKDRSRDHQAHPAGSDTNEVSGVLESETPSHRDQ